MLASHTRACWPAYITSDSPAYVGCVGTRTMSRQYAWMDACINAGHGRTVSKPCRSAPGLCRSEDCHQGSVASPQKCWHDAAAALMHPSAAQEHQHMPPLLPHLQLLACKDCFQPARIPAVEAMSMQYKAGIGIMQISIALAHARSQW